jgi:uncharacterized membrane protein
MNELLASYTALPNLHPAVVHFPIALLLGALATDIVAAVVRRQRWLDAAGAWLWLLGALGAGAAYLTGSLAEDSVAVRGEASLALSDHADWALYTLLAAAVVAAARVFLAIVRRGDERTGPSWLRAALLVAAIGVGWLVAQTGDRGGALVYRHGVAVRTAAPGGSR